MPYNEADTRAKLIDPALHARQWIELVKDEQRATHGEIHREQSAVRIEILDGKAIKRGRGRVDYRSKPLTSLCANQLPRRRRSRMRSTI